MVDFKHREKHMNRKMELSLKDELSSEELEELGDLNAYLDEADEEIEAASKWLKDFMTEVNTQDNRGTACPYYYELQYDTEDERGKQVKPYGTIFFTQKAADDYIQTNHYNLPENVYTYLCWGGRNPELKHLFESIGKIVGVPYERK